MLFLSPAYTPSLSPMLLPSPSHTLPYFLPPCTFLPSHSPAPAPSLSRTPNTPFLPSPNQPTKRVISLSNNILSG